MDTVKLKGGERILIRPISAEDKGMLKAGFDRLSTESRYRRFFGPQTDLSSTDLRYLTEIDHHQHEALVAISQDDAADPGQAMVGVARFVRGDDPSYAEVAVTVVDDWHHKGVAKAILDRLVDRAREVGVTHFVALVLSENDAALELFSHLTEAGAEPRESASGNVELLIELPEPGGELGQSKLGLALRSAAEGSIRINPWSVLKRTIRSRSEE